MSALGLPARLCGIPRCGYQPANGHTVSNEYIKVGPLKSNKSTSTRGLPGSMFIVFFFHPFLFFFQGRSKTKSQFSNKWTNEERTKRKNEEKERRERTKRKNEDKERRERTKRKNEEKERRERTKRKNEEKERRENEKWRNSNRKHERKEQKEQKERRERTERKNEIVTLINVNFDEHATGVIRP